MQMRVGIRPEVAHRRVAAQQLLMNSPELLAGSIQVALRRLESLNGSRCGHPTTADRLDHSQCLQGVGGVAQALVGTVQLLALLLGELLWLAAYVHAYKH